MMAHLLIKKFAGQMLAPIFDLGNRAIGKQLPPYWMRREVGSAKSANFEKVGLEFRNYLQTLAGLKRCDATLDIGCGCGRIALRLTDILDAGTYDGFDIMPEFVRWCRNNITPKYPQFQFQVADIYNKNYNPKGKISSEEYKFPFEDDRFDLVFLTSVFTHMRAPGFKNYLSQIVRVLKPGGRVLMTMFLINPAARQVIENGDAAIGLEHRIDDHCWVQNKRIPEEAIGFDEDYAFEEIQAIGLKIEHIKRGTWSGQGQASVQDIISASF
jgi:SAM-dependent methyltransferase